MVACLGQILQPSLVSIHEAERGKSRYIQFINPFCAGQFGDLLLHPHARL